MTRGNRTLTLDRSTGSLEGILHTLFTRACNRAVRVSETACVAIGDPFDKLEIVLQ